MNSDIVSQLNFNFNLTDGYGDDNEAFRFDLFLMTREIKQIMSSLTQVTLLPKSRQRLWIKENHDYLRHFMRNLTDEMFDVLDEVSLNQDVLQETITCVTELRELVNVLNSLMSGGKRLKS